MDVSRIFRMARAALVLAFLWTPDAVAQPQADAVKATFLYRFASFAEWPETAFDTPSAPIVLCISGASQFAGLVERAAEGERVAGRGIEVRRIGAVHRNSGCHILYTGGVNGQSVAQSLAAVSGQPVLTVTDSAYAATRGAIHFVLADDRVRFHIDRDAATQNHIALSSRLLGIALSVRERARGAL